MPSAPGNSYHRLHACMLLGESNGLYGVVNVRYVSSRAGGLLVGRPVGRLAGCGWLVGWPCGLRAANRCGAGGPLRTCRAEGRLLSRPSAPVHCCALERTRSM